MSLFDPDDSRPLHFMGISGAGMSALALIARQRGLEVTGCDLDLRDAADVKRAGAKVFHGHGAAHVANVRAVVHTSAIPTGHEELVAAADRGTRVLRRAEALGELVQGATVVGVAGTHGKTTTTAMVTEALAAAGRHPSGVTGGRVSAWGGNALLGGTDLYVVEADEYDRSFLALTPSVAVINNIEVDHLECYGDVEALEAAFIEFGNRATVVLYGGEDKGAVRVAARLRSDSWSVGLSQDCDATVSRIEQRPEGTEATITFPDRVETRFQLRVPGVHNVRNAAMALATCHVLDADVEAAANGLAKFGGVGRRFDVRGTVAGTTVVDDYAHHPTEVRATLEAARQRFGGARIIVVFQPHLFSRTQRHSEEFGRALAAADVVVVTDIYPAREEPIAGVDGTLVANAVRSHGTRVEWVPRLHDVVDALIPELRPGDVVVTMGAGDVTTVGQPLLERLSGAA